MLNNVALWLEQFHFLRPLWLLALIPAGALVLALWFRVTRAGQWQRWVAPHLLTYLIEGGQDKRRGWPLLAVLAMWFIAVIALAGPAWQKLPEPVQKGGSALVVVWDMSPSMTAQDIKPSRLTRARLKLIDLLRSRREGVTGLVAYAGEAHVITPLTDDTDTIISLLPALTPGNMPMAGSNTEMALEMAYGLLDDAAIANGQVLLITDGIAPEAYETLARIRRNGEHQLTIWGIGTPEGAPIPLSTGGFAKDRSGNMVIAKFDEDALQDFAAEIDAYYVPLLQSNEDIETLNRLFDAPSDNLRQTSRVFDNWYEHGPWLLLVILPLVALTFRRGWLLCLALFALPLSLPQPAHAGWDDLWKTPDQQGQEALAQQETERAAQLFEDPAWRGTALYRAGHYDAALEAFRQSDALRDLYNQGNSLMQLGDYQAAIEAYEKVLEQEPDHGDAQANKELAEQLLQQQQEEQQQGEQGDNQDPQEQEGQDGRQAKQQGEQGEQGQESDSQNSESQTESRNSSQASNGDQQDNEAVGADNPDEADQQSPQQQEQQDETDEQLVQDEPQGEDDADERQDQASASTELTDGDREQQQALEQWLRKVPDDPAGLIRNKMQYEFRQRRQSGQSPGQGNNAGQRW